MAVLPDTNQQGVCSSADVTHPLLPIVPMLLVIILGVVELTLPNSSQLIPEACSLFQLGHLLHFEDGTGLCLQVKHVDLI
ncbi:hypothetical protein D9M68_963600 [compost metagenome]